MSDVHNIAEFFSEAARQAAARCTYTTAADDPYGPPRNAAGQCPIGVMATIDLPEATDLHETPAACYVQEAFDAQGRKDWVFDPARDFIHLWDNHGISDLYDALNVARETAP